MGEPWENIHFQGFCSTPQRKWYGHPSIDVLFNGLENARAVKALDFLDRRDNVNS